MARAIAGDGPLQVRGQLVEGVAQRLWNLGLPLPRDPIGVGLVDDVRVGTGDLRQPLEPLLQGGELRRFGRQSVDLLVEAGQRERRLAELAGETVQVAADREGLVSGEAIEQLERGRRI